MHGRIHEVRLLGPRHYQPIRVLRSVYTRAFIHQPVSGVVFGFQKLLFACTPPYP